MTENGVVTLLRAGSGASGLLCLGTVPAWIYREEAVRNDGGGLFADDRFEVRIKAEYTEDIQAGDLVFFGRAETGCVDVSECRQIAEVVLNSFGTAPHWRLSSSRRYR